MKKRSAKAVYPGNGPVIDPAFRYYPRLGLRPGRYGILVNPEKRLYKLKLTD